MWRAGFIRDVAFRSSRVADYLAAGVGRLVGPVAVSRCPSLVFCLPTQRQGASVFVYGTLNFLRFSCCSAATAVAAARLPSVLQEAAVESRWKAVVKEVRRSSSSSSTGGGSTNNTGTVRAVVTLSRAFVSATMIAVRPAHERMKPKDGQALIRHLTGRPIHDFAQR